MSTAEHSLTQPAPSKEAVLDAAQLLIHQYGFTGFSMRDLAQQSGLAKATIYHHFRDKREIFLQVMERDFATVLDRIAVAAATPGDLQTRLRQLIIAFFELALERGALFISTMRQSEGMEQEIYTLLCRYREEIYRPIVSIFAEAVADGSIRPLDPELATVSFLGNIQGFTGRHLLTADIELDEATIDFMLDLFINGLLSPASNT